MKASLKSLSLRLLCLLLLLCFAGTKGHCSQGIPPRWLSHTPAAGNASYSFYVVSTDMASDLETARAACLKELVKHVEHDENIRIEEDYDNLSTQHGNHLGEVSGREENVYSLKIHSESGVQHLNYKKVDEYSERRTVGGSMVFKFYVLYMVARPGMTPRFDDVTFTPYYGARGVLRSLVPGWGQMYKGSTVKGLCILGGEAVCVAGIILSESTRASYVRKMKEQPRHAQTYNDKANNWETGRNVCIGAAAALYIYNLIDAAAAKGARRAVVRPRRDVRFSVAPAVMNDGVGVGFALNF